MEETKAEETVVETPVKVKNQIGILERIKDAKDGETLDKLFAEAQSYKHASTGTINKWKRAIENQIKVVKPVARKI